MLRYFFLTPVLGGPGAPRYPIGEELQLVGRSERAHIALLEPTVSREHASICCDGDDVVLEDLGSKHGTFVNSKRVSSTTNLKVGDIVVFGLSLVLRLEEADGPLPPAPELARSGPDFTVSIMEPLPGARSASAGESGQVTHVQRAPAPSADGLERLQEVVVKLHKLATVGANCAANLTEVYERLSRLTDTIRRNPSADPADLLDLLEPAVAQVGALLDDAEITAPRLDPVDLFDIARRAVAEVSNEADAAHVELLLGVPASIRVLSDAGRAQAALIELLRNAVASSPPGGAVTISCSPGEREVELRIEDQGSGIAADSLERLFDPFVTLRSDWRAVGLGVFGARHTVVSLGGRLTLEAAPGGGTLARISLPTA